MFKFKLYNVNELRDCGQAFCDAAREHASPDTEGYTRFILGWFANTACMPSGVYPRKREKALLFDQCHTTYEDPKLHRDAAWWKNAVERPCRVRLALESEWGKCNSANVTTAAILDDARKLAAASADTKVMVFGSHNNNHAKEIVRLLRQLRRSAKDCSPWLIVDWSYVDTPISTVLSQS